MKFSGHCFEVQTFCLRFSETEYDYYFKPSFCRLAHCSLLIHVKLDLFKAFLVNSGIFTGAAPGKACIAVRSVGWDRRLLMGASAVHPSCSGSPGHTRQTTGPVVVDTGHLPGAARAGGGSTSTICFCPDSVRGPEQGWGGTASGPRAPVRH